MAGNSPKIWTVFVCLTYSRCIVKLNKDEAVRLGLQTLKEIFFMNDVTKRFIDTYKSMGLTGYRMGKKSSVITKQKISNIEKGITEASTEILHDFFRIYKEVNPSYILTGDGEMLRKSHLDEKEESNALPSIVEFMEFPLVRQCAYAGYLSGYADNDYVESLPTATFVVDHIPHGNYISFDIKGDSMDDGSDEAYKEGDRVLCREIQMHLWADSKLHFKDWDFVIVHKDGILIKRIVDHNVEEKKITIHSLNPAYPDRDLDLCDVRQILNVVQQMRPGKR